MYHDIGKRGTGLGIFVLLITFPVWHQLGNAGTAPKPELPTQYKECVEPAGEMRANHMKLLNEWRDSALRDSNRIYVSKAYGKEYPISLQNTCMNCHANKGKFCDSCHIYAAAKPYCWDCHIAPQE